MDEYSDLVVVTVYALAASSVAMLAGLTGAVALLIQAPVVLFLPGYAVMSAALPSSSLDRLERLTMSLGLSIALTILGGLVVNLLPAGLGTQSWSILLTLVVIGGSNVAMLRRARLQAATGQELRLSPAMPVGAGARRLQRSLQLPAVSRRWRALGLCLALLVMTGAIIFSRESAMHQPYPGFTQLWVLPVQASNGQPGVELGIVNDETSTMSYTLVVKRDQETIRRITGIALPRRGTWEATMLIVRGSEQTFIEGDLYVAGRASSVYRSVKVWISPARNGT
jgi:uncharacterized membrane protein